MAVWKNVTEESARVKREASAPKLRCDRFRAVALDGLDFRRNITPSSVDMANGGRREKRYDRAVSRRFQALIIESGIGLGGEK
jgi:hypothetical protein